MPKKNKGGAGSKARLAREMKFSVLDRVILLNLLPQQGDIYSLRLVREFREEVGFSADERGLLDIRPGPEGKGVVWDDEGEAEIGLKLITVGGFIHQELEQRFAELNSQKKLGVEHVDLYGRFVEGKGDPEEPKDEPGG